MSDKVATRRRGGGALIALLAAAAVLLLAFAGLTGLGVLDPGARWFGLFGEEQAKTESVALTPSDTATDGAGGAPEDLVGTTMSSDDGEYPSQAQIEQMKIGDAGRFQAPSLDMNVPLNSMGTVDGVATPPGFRSAYLLRDHGVAPKDSSTGTTYVVMHSATKTGFAPGNYFVTKGGKARVPSGTVVSVDGVEYAITGHREIAKTDLPNDQEVWDESQPDRLVIVTCQQNNGARTTNNMVFFAQRV